MRTIYLVLSITLFAITANCQSGVYLSLEDFEQNKLTYATNATSDRIKIRFNEFIEKPFIIVKHNGQKIHVFKDEIYAYKNKNHIVRTWNFTPYYFLEKGPVWIYYKNVYVSQPKGMQRTRKYFYSTTGNSAILPLTVHNLKRSFPDNDLLHIALEAQFRNDSELAGYDNFANKFKVNYLLEKTSVAISMN